jgi:hypothetical protein
MSENKSVRALFCIGVNQNFFDATGAEAGQVWQAFSAVLKGIANLPGVRVIGTMDDDRIMVGPSLAAPWTAYVLADVPDMESATAACNLFRVTPVGDGTYKLWKYCRVEARLGRAIEIPQ